MSLTPARLACWHAASIIAAAMPCKSDMQNHDLWVFWTSWTLRSCATSKFSCVCSQHPFQKKMEKSRPVFDQLAQQQHCRYKLYYLQLHLQGGGGQQESLHQACLLQWKSLMNLRNTPLLLVKHFGGESVAINMFRAFNLSMSRFLKQSAG